MSDNEHTVSFLITAETDELKQALDNAANAVAEARDAIDDLDAALDDVNASDIEFSIEETED